MDINTLLKNVNNVDEYISVTQEIVDKSQNMNVQINITTVLALKRMRSLEIEYLNKCQENGAACALFERLLKVPPSKTWGVLGKELVSLLQYWLEAVRKYLINGCGYWWNFLKLILKFIMGIHQKDPTIADILVELTAECLFDIASRESPDVHQRHEILHCLNIFCAESSREIRFAMRNEFGDYFYKLSSHVLTSGYLPCQYSALEALVRWLVPRQDRTLRASSAARWLPPDLCPATATEIFLNTNWMNFFQDARDFLNAVNESNGLVTSMVCRKLKVGNILIISGMEKQQAWLDINSSMKSISILLDPRALEVVGMVDSRACEALVVAHDNVRTAQLHSESQEVTISLNTYRPPSVLPSDESLKACDVNIVVSSRVDLKKLDNALKMVFGDKYHLLMDLDSELGLSPIRTRDQRKNQRNSEEEETRLSHPVEVSWKRAGYVVKSINTRGLITPSSASTSSLAQLHDKLAALPLFKYHKEPKGVCAEPELSCVTEISETDDKSFHSTSTLKLRPYHGYKHLSKPTKKKAGSDSETLKIRHLSSVTSNETSVSCLLAATIGSDDSIINDTIERFSERKEFKISNLSDLLVQEALQAKPITKEKIIECDIKSGNKKSQENEENTEAIENTPIQGDIKETFKEIEIARKKNCTVVSKSTTDDESNTEAINETPTFTNLRKSKLSRKQSVPKATDTKVANKQSFDIRTVEEFFSQHFAETKTGEIVISPCLAKKINESSSETSDNFDDLIMNEDLNADVEQFEFNDIEIIECLNDMVDKVCSDFEKCTEYLKEADVVSNKSNLLKETQNADMSIQQTVPVPKLKRNIKLTYKAKKEKKPGVVTKKRKNSVEQKPTKKMSTIIELKDEETLEDSSSKKNIKDIELAQGSPENMENETKSLVNNQNMETPLRRRKRKLYSPKDDEMEKERKGIKVSETEDADIALSELKTYNIMNSSKTTATCYKEIERERQKHIRLPRSKKSRGKIEESPSPRTLRMDAVFDKLKETVESREKIVLVDKNAVQSEIYNFNSESEDDDFKKKKIEVQKRTSTTTVGSFESAMSARPGRPRTRPNYSEKSSNDEFKISRAAPRRKTIKKTNRKMKVTMKTEPDIDLTDERMKEAGPEVLNTSIVVQKPKATKVPEVELAFHEPAQMEPIIDIPDAASPEKKKSKRKTKKAEINSFKKGNCLKNDELKLVSDKEDDKTESSLPGLVVESVPVINHKHDRNDLVTAKMLQKVKKIYQDGYDAINESTNTQNMLFSDIDKCNYSPQIFSVNITDEMYFVEENIKKEKSAKYQPKKKTDPHLNLSKNENKIKMEKTNLNQGISAEIIEISEIPDVNSDKSIATDGITAHGDFDEAPPSPEMIRQHMQPREIEDLNGSMKDYFVKLNREIYNSNSKDRRESSKSTEGADVTKVPRPIIEKTSSVIISPVVSIKRLSYDDFGKWLPSPRTSETDNSAKSSPKVRGNSECTKAQREDESIFQNVQKKIPEAINNPGETHKYKSKEKKGQKIKQSVFEYAKEMSHVAPISAISLEEFNNWLPMPKSLEPKDISQSNVTPLQKKTTQNSLKLVYNTRQKSKALKDIVKTDDKSIKENTKSKKSNTKSTELASPGKNESSAMESTIQDCDLTSNRLKASSKNKGKATAKKTKSKTFTTTIDSDSNHQEQTTAKDKIMFERSNTVISPIKSFEDFVTNIHNNNKSDDDHSIKKLRETLYKTLEKPKARDKNITLRKCIPEKHSPDSTSTQIMQILCQDSTRKIKRLQDSNSTKVKDTVRLNSDSTKVKETARLYRNSTKEKETARLDPNSTKEKETVTLDSNSTKVDESFKRSMKRKSSPLQSETKKMTFEANIDTVTIESRPSVSSIHDWFRRMEPARNRDDTNLSFRDMINNVMEKLDTTLVESNRNTSKRLVNLFVEAQNQLVTQQEQRREIYKTVATQIITQMVSIMDEKFADLDKRSQEMDSVFKEQLKKQAFELIREDCNQKRVMVLLLKEDVQAVLDHIERNKTDSP